MKLPPRDISGTEVAQRLARHYGVPRHRDVRVGTLDATIADVAAFLRLPKQAATDTLFG